MRAVKLPRLRVFVLLVFVSIVTVTSIYFLDLQELNTNHSSNTTTVLKSSYGILSNHSRRPPQYSDLQVVNKNSGICYTISEASHLEPLDDFRKYPCLKDLPRFPDRNWSKAVQCVRTYCYHVNKNQSTKIDIQRQGKCVSLKTLRGTTPICTYPANTDIHVSASIQRSGAWEGQLVNNLAKFILARPGTEFFDFGCNIGAYTLSIANLGIKVTAIDPLLENMNLLSRSLELGKLQQNVTLIWNAVSDKHTLIKFKADKSNVGGTRIINANDSRSFNARGYYASTITLDDLLPLFKGKRVAIKMDIEESEYNALVGGQRFLDEVDIVVIQMEFLFHKTGKDGPKIFNYLASKRFDPFKDLGRHSALKNRPLRSWPNDVYFMKSP